MHRSELLRKLSRTFVFSYIHIYYSRRVFFLLPNPRLTEIYPHFYPLCSFFENEPVHKTHNIILTEFIHINNNKCVLVIKQNVKLFIDYI